MNPPAYIQMDGNTVANAKRMALSQIKCGDIYVVMGTYLCRVLKIGPTDYPETPTFTKHYPNCITVLHVGWRVLDGRWWDFDWLKRDAERDRHQYDLCYFFPWDRQGILYGSTKARRIKKMVGELFHIGLKLRGYENRHDKPSLAIYTKARTQREEWDVRVEALFNSLADPKRYPKLPPPRLAPPTIKGKATAEAWSEL